MINGGRKSKEMDYSFVKMMVLTRRIEGGIDVQKVYILNFENHYFYLYNFFTRLLAD